MQLINDNKYIIIFINVIKINLLLHNTFITSYDGSPSVFQVTEVGNIVIHSKNRHVSVINHIKQTDTYFQVPQVTMLFPVATH